MRIAQVSPLYESVPPQLYGGTERIVSYLTEELVKQGHDVTLFASADSVTKAKLITPGCNSLRLQKDCIDPMPHHYVMMEMLNKNIENFDIVHYHIDYIHFPLTRRSRVAHVTTLHGRLDIPDLQPLYREYADIPLVSISNNQRLPLPDANWKDTVYHGLPKDLYNYKEGDGKYFAFIGRFSPEKRADRAIEIAKAVGVPIKLAAKVADADRKYFEREIKPLLDHPLVEYIGEIGEKDKNEFLGNALALLFPIDWPEPFGLVMIESMACGTPVLAWKKGSVPEVLEDGVSGILVESMEEAIEGAKQIVNLDRKKVRAAFDNRFTAEVMANNYLELYEELINVKPIDEVRYMNF